MMLSIVLDTSFLIASNNAKDVNHKAAASLKSRIRDMEFGRPYVTDYIFDEFVTFLMVKSFPLQNISELGDSLLSEEDIKFFSINKDVFNKAWGLFKKLKSSSFTDCTTSVLAEELNIKHIASYDSEFDKFAHLKRVG